MKILKENAQYKLVDTKDTHYSGSYQLREINNDYPNGETCGIYFNKKDAIKDFNKFSKGINK